MTGAVVYGIDDSAGATSTARVAHVLAERFGLPLLFVHVVQPGAGEDEVAATEGRLREAVDGVSADASRQASAPVVVVPPAESDRQVGEGGEPSFAGGIVRFDLGSSAPPGV
jgi:nucleotide-binding universal stress UspA family protein